MGSRDFENGKNYTKGMVYMDFSFLTNNTSNPLNSTFRGAAENIASITRSNVGILVVTLLDQYRYVVDKYADLEDLNASDDGAYASIGAIQNEATAGAQLSFNIYTRAAAGTKTDYTNRRVSVCISFKNSALGV